MTTVHTPTPCKRGDFRVIDGGSVIGFSPISDDGREWWAQHVQAHEGWQSLHGMIWIDYRPAQDIINGFQADGLTIREI